MHYKSKSLAYVQSLLQTCFIYEFCKNRILKGFTNRDSKLIYEAIPPIDEILDGWVQIK